MSAATRRPASRRGIESVLIFPPPARPLSLEEAHELLDAAKTGHDVAVVSMGYLAQLCHSYLEYHPTPDRFEAFREHVESHSPGQPGLEHWNNMRIGLESCWNLRDTAGDRALSSGYWFRQGAERGNGAALAGLGLTKLMPRRIEDNGESRIVTDAPAARTLLDAAMRTRDPSALFVIGLHSQTYEGELFPALTIDNGLTWVYAACRLGMDCSGGSDWLQTMCPLTDSCGMPHGRSLNRYLEYHMFTPRQREEAAEQVVELLQLIEAGDWNRLRVRLPDDPSLEEAMDAEEPGNSEDVDGN